MKTHLLLLFLPVGMFGVDSHGVSVMEGDPVTLPTNVTITQQEDVKYYFNNTLIAQLTGDLRFNCTDVQCNEANKRFRGRLKLDNETGSLTITNTTSTDTGGYHQEIIGSGTIHENIFNVSVHNVSAAERDEIKRNSAKEGESDTSDSDENNLNDSGRLILAVAGICAVVVIAAFAFATSARCAVNRQVVLNTQTMASFPPTQDRRRALIL
ncbi:uncharacterized protein LOC130215472 [Danio aesculapii]|uniref:uncharacterized protein LOC130215472 n=1 Tax=Danio aesculapii TaxID=1142201 RepID=UPI0024C0AC8C|nr:uncharacterized protein LOC130215472 [Danio aesculapii]